LHAIYRVIAAHRHCIGGVCKIPRRRAWRARLPLLLLPVLAIAVRDTLPAWVFMWLIAFAIYAGFKWLTYRDTLVQGMVVRASTRLIYLLFWPGMSLQEFAGTPAARKLTNSAPMWLAPTTKTLAGAGLLWLAVPVIPADAWLLRGWVGMIGMIMMLHFGMFHLLALALRASGLNARANMQAPLLARSLADFWGNRWNTAFNVLADRYGFRPLTQRIGPRAALAVVFIASGLLHEAVIVLGHGKNSVLPNLLRLGRLGLGGSLAGGRQFVSWIHEDDFCRAVEWIIEHEGFCGPVNLAAPNPVTNAELMASIRKVGRVPFGLPAPRWLLEVGAFLMRTETELVIKSRRVVPGKLLACGFSFRHSHLLPAIEQLVA
jgi:hypothetical protein